jgi:hypothetical protein
MFEDMDALGIKLDWLGKICLQKQIDDIKANVTEEDLNNKDFMRGMSRILCGAMGYHTEDNKDMPSPMKEMMLYAWIKYSFLAVIKLKMDKGFELSYVMDGIPSSEFEDLAKNFSKVTLDDDTTTKTNTGQGEQQG